MKQNVIGLRTLCQKGEETKYDLCRFLGKIDGGELGRWCGKTKRERKWAREGSDDQ